MCRYQKCENIQQLQLEYYDYQYYLNEIEFNKKSLFIDYFNKINLNKIKKKN